MTNPSDPGHPPRPPERGGGPSGPYGPPPPPPPQHHRTGPIPVPRPGDPGPGPQNQGPGPQDPAYGPPNQGQGYGPQDQGWAPPPRGPANKGVIGTLVEMNFDHMITPRLIKLTYLFAVLAISWGALLLAWYGLSYSGRGYEAYGLFLMIAAPFLWFALVLVVRILLEFVINQFKITEYLRAIKDKD